MKKYYYNHWFNDFFTVEKYKKGDYPYKIKYYNGFYEKTNWVTSHWLSEFKKGNGKYFTLKQVKNVSFSIRKFQSKLERIKFEANLI